MKIEDFRNPPIEYRPAPFFSVNDDIQEERLLEFVDEFFEQGWGGLFFHARSGLVTPYMGNRWFNLVRACVKRYKELGGRFWIYDENGWPSGQGGGQVTKLGPKYRDKLLLCKPAGRGIPPAGTIRTQSLREGGKRNTWNFLVKVMPIGWLPDLLDPEPVRAFLESTHELYKIHVGEEFGRVVPGIFTDEPQYTTHHTLSGQEALPWTDRLPEEFEKDHGYSILDNLGSLFFDIGSFRKVRYHFFSTVTRLYVESYSMQIYEWCEANNLKYTGHYEWEDSFLGQIHCIGSAMQHYEYMQQPGIDHLGRGIHNPWVEKQVSSVASQLGKRRVLSETYGVSGQSLSFHDRRWIGNWQFALGINFLCQHLALYSLRGSRKRDYPPTLSPHQPWWPHNRIVADYFSRLGYVLSEGRRMVDVLVLSSIGSAWCEYKPSDFGPVEHSFDGFKTLTENLLASQIDFEYGEEFILAGHGDVKGKKLQVGMSRYRVVVLPPMKSLKRTTFDLLKRFAMSGGAVICVGERPSMIEGEESEDLSFFVSGLPLVENTKEGVSSLIKPQLIHGPDLRWASGAPIDRLIVHRRRIGRADLHFLVNTDCQEPMRLEVDFRSERTICELVPLTGKVLSCSRIITVDLAGGEGRIFTVGLDVDSGGKVGEIPDEPSVAMPVKGVWRIAREDPNQCVLDFARWRSPGGKWSKPIPVWRVQDAVSSLGEGEEFEVRYQFDSDRSRPLDLVVEDAHRLDIYVNGEKVISQTDSWWLDPSFKRIPVGDRVKAGKNVVVLKGRRASDLSMEDAYLLGDFAVRVSGLKIPVLTDEDHTCRDISDLRESGYPFYAGTMKLETEIMVEDHPGRPYVEFDELGGTIAEFTINGTALGKVFWREYRLEVGKALKPGRNRITVKLINDLRNLLGPRHWKGDKFKGVSPHSFRDADGWTDGYVGTPLGIGRLKITWR